MLASLSGRQQRKHIGRSSWSGMQQGRAAENSISASTSSQPESTPAPPLALPSPADEVHAVAHCPGSGESKDPDLFCRQLSALLLLVSTAACCS
eukprot:3940816-Rhodomonas_salina.4